MRRFYISQEQKSGSTVTLTGSDANHIRNVLRGKSGDSISLFDGCGHTYAGKIIDTAPGRITVVVLDKFAPDTESPLHLVLAQAFLKDRKMDDLVRHITELGVTAWIAVIAQRSVAKPDPGRFAGRLARWNKIAGESLKQCGRSYPPDIRIAASMEEMFEWTAACDLKIVFWGGSPRPLAHPLPKSVPTPIRRMAVAIGPEGGFTEAEIDVAREHGFITATLGPRILKADTAAVAACALAQHLFGDMG